MPDKNARFKQEMQPWPSIASYAKEVNLQEIDLKIFYYEAGFSQDQPLFMIHGLGDEADTWRHVLLPLAEEFHIFAIDLPGFGRSDQPDVDYTPQFIMKTLLRFMDQLSIKSPILMGSSLGAILAHGIAIHQPELVSKLILVGGGLLQNNARKDWGLRLMRLPILGEWLYTRLRKDSKAAFASLRSVYHQLEHLPKDDRDFLFTRVNQRVWSDGQRRAYFSTLRKLIPWYKYIQENLPDQLKQFEIPTLIIRGEFDQLFSKFNADEIARLQPKATNVIIQGVGHLPHQENPESFLQEVIRWHKQLG